MQNRISSQPGRSTNPHESAQIKGGHLELVKHRERSWIKMSSRVSAYLCASVVLFSLEGCIKHLPDGEISNASAALNGKNYLEAITQVDQYIATHPDGDRMAEAYYIRGRAMEDMPAPNKIGADANLQQARIAYIAALQSRPGDEFDAVIRASLADVAYWQEDYSTTVEQGMDAYPRLPDGEVRANTLYRVGGAQQRLGRFEDADKTFQLVVSKFARFAAADRARSRIGVRSFYVQVATFAKPDDAQRSAADLVRQGLPASMESVEGNRHILRVGVYGNYGQANAVKSQLLSRFPDALVVP